MPYQSFARFYDGLTANVDYDALANRVHHIITQHKDKCELVLDLACGTGSLAQRLARMGYEVIGVDASAEMLMEASAKNAELDHPVLYLCQPMEQLDLFGTIDAVVCTLDSINHVTDEPALQEAVRRVALFLEPGGLFLFDSNTPYKHREVLGDNAFIYENEDVVCLWQNSVLVDGLTVQVELDFFSQAGKGLYSRHSESFCEKAYSREFLTELLEKAGLRLLSVTDEDGAAPRQDSQRLQYLAIKD